MVASTLQTPSKNPSFWLDLNVFIAAFAIFVSLGSFVVIVPMSLLAKLLLPSRQADFIVYPLSYSLVALGLGYWWWKHGLSPRRRSPARLGRLRWGHVLLTVFNLAMFIMVVPAYLGAGYVLPQMQLVAGLLIRLMPLIPLTIIAGLFMVLSARETRPEFAATVPATQCNPDNMQPTKLLPESTRVELAPAAIAVVLGVLVSSVLLYVAAIFAGLSFQGNPQRYTSTFLPIVGGLYVFYVSTALWLLSKRSYSAGWVAWAPTIFLTVVLPVLGMIMPLLNVMIGTRN